MHSAEPDIERVTRWVLTAVLGLGCVAWLITRLVTASDPVVTAQLPPWPWSVVAGVALWLAWARVSLVAGQRPVAAVVFTVLACLAPVADGSGATQQLPQAAVVTMMLVFGARWAGVTVAAFMALIAAGVLWFRSAADLAPELAGALVLMLFAYLLAYALHRARVSRNRTAAVLDRLASSSRQLRELSLLQERSRTAGELHDGLGHRLTAIAMGLRVAEQTHRSDPERSRTELSRTSSLVTDALQDLRRWVRALGRFRPGEHRGVAAVRAIVDSFAGTTLRVELTTTGPDWRLDDEREVVLYRIVQESLTNVVRHSTGQRVHVRLAAERSTVRVTVADDGAATPPADGPTGTGYGLDALTDRVNEVGGRIATEAGPTGFTVTATLPTEPGPDPVPTEPVPA